MHPNRRGRASRSRARSPQVRYAYYPVFVHRPAASDWVSFIPRLATTPLPFSLPSALRKPGHRTFTYEVTRHARRTRSSSAAPRSGVGWSDLLIAFCIFLLQNDQRDPTEYGYGRQYQTQGYGFPEKKDATQGRNDRNTELHCRSVGCFQCRQCGVPNDVPYSGSQCTDETAYQNPALSGEALSCISTFNAAAIGTARRKFPAVTLVGSPAPFPRKE